MRNLSKSEIESYVEKDQPLGAVAHIKSNVWEFPYLKRSNTEDWTSITKLSH